MHSRESKWALSVSLAHLATWNPFLFFERDNHGILNNIATAEKVEDQCELPGCTKPKRQEGTRVHEYCCLDHASQDAPNRDGKLLIVKQAFPWFHISLLFLSPCL